MAAKMALIGVVLAATPIAAACAEDTKPAAGTDVRVAKVRTECFANVVWATGRIIPRATAVVTFSTPGFQIAEISKQDGDSVKTGDEVAVLVPAGAPPQTDAERKEIMAKRVVIKSPVSGVVLRRHADVGAVPRGPLLSLAVDGEMEASIDVPSVYVLQLNSGQGVHLVTEDGREFNGHVRLVPAEVDRATQRGEARISIDNGPSLIQGLFLRAAIDIGRSCGLGVPLTAVRRVGGSVTLQVVKNGTIETRNVTLGLSGENDIEVAGGLVEGDVVVADGDGFLWDGDKVRPVVVNTQDGH